MKFDDPTLRNILLHGGYVSKEDLDEAERLSKTNASNLLDVLFNKELINKDMLGQAIAEAARVTYFDLESNPPNQTLLERIPIDAAHQHRVIPVKEDAESITVATDNPLAEGLQATLKEFLPEKNIKLLFSLPMDIDSILGKYQKPLETRFAKIIESNQRVAPEIIDEILSDSLIHQSSDIHFEPQGNHVIIRFRVDGVLRKAGQINKELYENILNRIKVQSRLRIDEHLAAQDGSMRFEKENMVIDLRTSIIPTVEGEKVVLRVLSAYVEGFGLSNLGISEKKVQDLRAAASKPFGMILVTGPTGAGKTTTLYALLKLLNQPEVNITTIEDPVEYKVRGVNQIQVNESTNLTFAQGLRSIVRQDPDIILVGEIRDEETAEIGMNAALTGHLLLSTFHANDAATAIPRLLDMGIEPFLLASTLELLLAQRLLRKLCMHCRYSTSKTAADLNISSELFTRLFGSQEKTTLYEGKGCEVCGNSGFKGRTVIVEMIHMTPEMQNLVLKSPSTQEIWTLAREQGSTSLFEDGMEKVKNGVTTLDELKRIAELPSHLMQT